MEGTIETLASFYGRPWPLRLFGDYGRIVYQKQTPEFGFDKRASAIRIALGAQVEIQILETENIPAIQELSGYYSNALEQIVKVVHHYQKSNKALLQPAHETARR